MKEYDYWNRLNIEDLLWTVEEIAKDLYDGHFTIMRFTTHYKAEFGTPDVDTGKGRIKIRGLLTHTTLKEALIALLMCERILIFPPKQDRYWKGRMKEIVESTKIELMFDEFKRENKTDRRLQ